MIREIHENLAVAAQPQQRIGTAAGDQEQARFDHLYVELVFWGAVRRLLLCRERRAGQDPCHCHQCDQPQLACGNYSSRHSPPLKKAASSLREGTPAIRERSRMYLLVFAAQLPDFLKA